MANRVLAAGLACAALVLAAPAMAQQQPAPEVPVDIAAIPGVIAGDAQWRAHWSGPMIVDGMTTAPDGGLLFAQEQSNSIIKVWPDGKWWVQWPFVAGAGSVSIDAQGRTFAADRSCTDPGLGLGANCTILSKIVQLTPERKTIADKFADGTTLGRINDLAADGHGGAYYTQGGLFHAKADGTVDTIAAAGNPQQGGLFTNGLVLSPDGRTLYVTNRLTMLAFDVGPDGSLSNRRDFATLQGEPQGSFGGDGLTVDADGRLYVTGGAGIYVFDKAGKQLGVIPTPRRAITAAFAGPDRKTLYIGTLGANTPTGENWATPQGVRNIAATIYAVDTLAAGARK
ncbi:MAG TPA: SMP-30/gluconolactonase/LRE family protein [Croceibacterium sp.]|nr:SMP-30/gluconolactonase/LRE family protein [Croceibacterium sp.]